MLGVVAEHMRPQRKFLPESDATQLAFERPLAFKTNQFNLIKQQVDQKVIYLSVWRRVR